MLTNADLACRVRDRHPLSLQNFNLTKLRYDFSGLLPFSSHSLILQITGQNYPSWRTNFMGLLHSFWAKVFR